MSWYLWQAFAVICVTFTSALALATPTSLTFSGRLQESDDLFVDGAIDIKLRLFATEDGGTPLFSESFAETEVVEGRFSLLVGGTDSALVGIFAGNDTLFWELEVDGETLAPRQRITAVPWALGRDSRVTPTQVTCPEGHALIAIDVNGLPSCVPVLMSLPTGMSCPDGEVLAAIGADGQPECLPLPTATQLALWSGAVSWGNHATAGYLTVEEDPRVGQLEPDGWCVSDGETVRCEAPAPVLVERDPTVNNLATTALSCQTGDHPTATVGTSGTTWRCTPNAAVLVTDFGAIPDDSGDDRVAIYLATCHALANRIGTVAFPAGTYRVSGNSSLIPKFNDLTGCASAFGGTAPTTTPRQNLHFLGLGAAKILQTGATSRHAFFDFWPSPEGSPDLRISNLDFDGADLVAVGIQVRTSDVVTPGARFVVEGCRFTNFRQNEGISTAANAVTVNSPYDIAIIRDSYVDRMSRSAAGTTTGFSIGNVTGVATIENNVIRNITTPSDTDADGIKIFGRMSDTGTRLGKGIARSNLLENCEGRGIKFQIADALAENNTITLNAGKMITNFHAIDAQAGAGVIRNNRVNITTGVTISLSASMFLVQIEGFTARFAKTEPRYASITDNRLFTDQRLGYFVGISHPENAPAVVDIANNTVGPINGDLGNDAAVATFLQYQIPSGQVARSHLTLRVAGNTVRTNGQLVLFRNDTSDAAVDLRATLSLSVVNNRNLFRGAANPPTIPRPTLSGDLFKDPAKVQIDDITISGNSDFRNMTWYGYLNGLYIGDGSSINYGTAGASGGLENGHTTRTSWVVLERRGNILRSQSIDGTDVHQVGIRTQDSGVTFWGAWKRLD